MVVLYVTSLEKGSGKTAVCAGIGRQLARDGNKIGFLKPIIISSNNTTPEGTDRDTAFMKEIFTLEESADLLCPVFNNESDLSSCIKDAVSKISQGKDIIIVEGSSTDVIEKLDAKVIIIEKYSKELLKALDSYKAFGESLLGIVVNMVPKNYIEQIRTDVKTQLAETGINILGILPEDRALFALTVDEIAKYTQGEIKGGTEKTVFRLVEDILVGAMSIDSGLEYFGRKDNKGVIIKSNRPDMELAALETSTSCLVLSGESKPKLEVLNRAEEKNIPIILTSDNIPTIIENIENNLSKTRFNHETKMQKFAEIMEQCFNLQAVNKGLGLAV